jgi:hypothetical protein
MKWEFFCQQTFKQQIEILPRFTILYGGYPKVVAFEFLWFVVGFMKGIENNDCKEHFTEESYVHCQDVHPVSETAGITEGR